MRRAERWARALFGFALLFAAFGYGIVAGIGGLPPAPQLQRLYGQALDLQRYWRNDLGLEPSRHLVPAYHMQRRRFAVLAPAALPAGHLLVAGLTPQRPTLNSVIMYDRDGRERHVWPVDYRRLDPDGPRPENIFLHGLAFFEDGSIIVNFDEGYVLARLDACGTPRWVIRGKYHHAASRSHDGTLWTWRDDTLVQIDPDTGAVLREIRLLEDLLQRGGLQGVLGIRTEESVDGVLLSTDAFHPNHVEVLDPARAAAFPRFAPGDLLISLRSLNLVAVLDPHSLDFKWWRVGPWHRQHNPHFTRDGRILVYNNNMNFGRSDIVAADPHSGALEVLFAGSERLPFYSWRRGRHQLLDDGALLITESERGRAFIVDRRGRLVWEYNNVYDAARNGVLSGVTHLPHGFFARDAFACAGRGGAGPQRAHTRPLRFFNAAAGGGH